MADIDPKLQRMMESQTQINAVLKWPNMKVHVLWQKSAWLTERLCATNWIECFAADLERLGLEGVEKLIASDNLAAQKCESFVSALRRLNCKSVYGPKNGTVFGSQSTMESGSVTRSSSLVFTLNGHEVTNA